MATPVSDRAEITPAGFAALSRAVVSAAAELVGTVERAVIGDANVRTARGNAWDAICADRARAQARDEMDQLVRALLAAGPRPAAAAGSAPRTSALTSTAAAARPEPRAAQAEPHAARTDTRAAQAEPRADSRAARTDTRAAQRASQPAAERAAQASSRGSRTRPASQNRAAGQNQPAAKSRRGGKAQRAVGSSPRSSASQAALVSTGSTTR